MTSSVDIFSAVGRRESGGRGGRAVWWDGGGGVDRKWSSDSFAWREEEGGRGGGQLPVCAGVYRVGRGTVEEPWGVLLVIFSFFLVRVSAQREGLEGSLPNSLFFLGNTDTWNSRPTVPPTDDITHVSWWMSRKHPTVLPLEL